ncbi:MAG: nitrous oxide reductase family maturation protein NosD [Terriglobia bacterium]
MRNPSLTLHSTFRQFNQILLLWTVLGLWPVSILQAEVLQVGKNQPFGSVMTALFSAKPGDTIQVFAGTYTGSIRLNKQIILEGIGKPIVHGSGKGSVIEVLAPGCVVRGLIIEHGGEDLQNEDSGILLKSNSNVVENNELRDTLFGIYLFQSSGNRILQNRIQGRVELEMGERGAGIHLWNSTNNRIEGNQIHEARDGMYIQNSSHNLIRINKVTRLRYGLHYMNSDDNIFEDNVFAYNVAGAAIMYSRHIQFRRNAFMHNRGFSSFGILFQGCEDNLAENNLIVDNVTGLFLEAVYGTVFIKNVVAENDVAMQIFSSSDHNLFSENQFVDNLSPLQMVGKTTGSSWHRGDTTDFWNLDSASASGVNGRGNFWSDYDGYDLDGDGIGDVPHKIQNVFEYMEGNYPRLRLYLDSPAAQALSLAEKVFPVVPGSAEVDPAPLMRRMESPMPAIIPEASPAFHGTLGTLSLTMLAGGLVVVGKGFKR